MLKSLRVHEAQRAIDGLLEAIIGKVALDIESQAKQKAPVDTGHLRASIGVRKTGKLSAEVAASAHYAAYVELGRGT